MLLISQMLIDDWSLIFKVLLLRMELINWTQGDNCEELDFRTYVRMLCYDAKFEILGERVWNK